MLDDRERKIFAENLNFYMNKFGKSQADIVSDLGINKSTISLALKPFLNNKTISPIINMNIQCDGVKSLAMIC